MSEKSLRAEAEEILVQKSAQHNKTIVDDHVLHELLVHQIELEMQNEELRRAQGALEELRDRYLDLYEFAPVGYVTLSKIGMILEINLTGAKIIGFERSRLLNHRFVQFVQAEDRERWNRHFLRTLNLEGIQAIELLLLHPDSSRFAVNMECQRIVNVGRSSGMRFALSDITKRKQMEEELRIAAITFQSQEGIIISDAKGHILKVNDAFTRLTGYTADEVIGRNPSIFSSGRHGHEFYQNMWTQLLDNGCWQGEIWNKRKSGKVYAEWLNISAVRTVGGEISHYVATFSDITMNKDAEAKIHRLAYYDALTNLPNRMLLADRIGQSLLVSRRIGRHGAVMFLDLDNFKKLNDTRGHAVGDLLLIEVAKRLQALVREGDTVARLGGDEFVIMLDNLSSDMTESARHTQLVGEKILQCIARPFTVNGQELFFMVSIGATLFFDERHQTDELLKQADIAMYQAKKQGRNTIRFFDHDMQQSIDASERLERDMRRAIEHQEFKLYFQVQVQVQVGALFQLTGAEVLIRWEHPERGLIAPDDFIPLAEETGLIKPIGRWVLETACAQIATWQKHPQTRGLMLSVNVSARQFQQSDFADMVQAVVVQHGIDPELLKLELTESMLLDNIDSAISIMNTLKTIGVQISLDDFGTGYSSLQYLRSLPIDQLKIDRSFINKLLLDEADKAIVCSIITLGQNLNMNVIAEGVETSEQQQFLLERGCNHYQGYLYGKPVPIEIFNLDLI